MSKDQDKFIAGEDYDLEDILAEFSAIGPEENGPPPPSEEPEGAGSVAPVPAQEAELPWPTAVRREHKRLDFPIPPYQEDLLPDQALFDLPEEVNVPPAASDTKVLEFPGGQELPPAEEVSPLEDGIEKLKKKADAFADGMFAQEGVEVSEQTMRMERLIPGVDEEEEPPPPRRKERKPRPRPTPPPDVPPEELYHTYTKGLNLLRLRWLLVTLLCVPQLMVMLMGRLDWPPLIPLQENLPLQNLVTTCLFLACAALALDVWGMGLVRLFQGKPGMDTLLAFSVLFTAADALTLQTLAPRDGQLPYTGVVTVALAFALRGVYHKRRGLRITCRVAASAQEPYLVTLDEGVWKGKGTYAKHMGTMGGFGSQIQTDDGAQRMFRLAVPVILAACMALSLLASVGKGRGEYLLWCLSATFTVAAAFGSLMVYAKPFRALAKRLSVSGAALAGWDGMEGAGRGILLTDTDLFPPGTVALNGIKIFGDFPIEKVVAVTASIIRQSGSGLDKIFKDLLRAQAGTWRRCDGFAAYEGGGLSATIRDQQILVGSASFMALMEIRMPQGLNVKNAVFCSIDGELAGIFALNYNLHGAISPAVYALIHNRVSPILATRDFNIIPAMLRQRFKLPVEKMEYPAVERRIELSHPEQPHNEILTALLCREGLGPYAEAVVGAQRLRKATVLASALTCFGSVVGVLLVFYLAVSLSFSSLAPLNLLVFLLMWLVPTYLISGWVNKF